MYAFQTDSIEGWIREKEYPSLCVTVTSSHCQILQRHVSVLISITFARTGPHYRSHFEQLLKGINYKSLDHFMSRFPGNISDFSAGEVLGFKLAVRKTFKIPTTIPSQDLQLENVYQYCTVHFKRSAARIKNNHSLVHKSKKDEFQHCINILLSKTRTDVARFEETIKNMKQQFPSIKKWVEWYEAEHRAKCIFPAMQNGGIPGFGDNTNAQEGLGGWIQRGYSSDNNKRPNLIQALKHLQKVAEAVHKDILDTKEGNLTRYGEQKDPIERAADTEAKKKRKQAELKRREKYVNDGRAPDSTDALIKTRARTTAKRARTAPTATDMAGLWKGFPWSCIYENITMTNTCPLDSFMALAFLMRKCGLMSQDRFQMDKALTQALNHIDAGRHAKARHGWIQHLKETLGASELSVDGRRWNLWSDSLVHSNASSLFQIKLKHVFDVCNAQGENCLHHSAYEDGPDKLVSQPFISNHLMIKSDR